MFINVTQVGYRHRFLSKSVLLQQCSVLFFTFMMLFFGGNPAKPE
jgi:hypothetical protein